MYSIFMDLQKVYRTALIILFVVNATHSTSSGYSQFEHVFGLHNELRWRVYWSEANPPTLEEWEAY